MSVNSGCNPSDPSFSKGIGLAFYIFAKPYVFINVTPVIGKGVLYLYFYTFSHFLLQDTVASFGFITYVPRPISLLSYKDILVTHIFL
jgi:hypothetical protein